MCRQRGVSHAEAQVRPHRPRRRDRAARRARLGRRRRDRARNLLGSGTRPTTRPPSRTPRGARRSTCARRRARRWRSTATSASRTSTPTSSTACTASGYKSNRNSIYQWTSGSHTGGFTQRLPAIEPAATWSARGAAERSRPAGQPPANVINCRVVEVRPLGDSRLDKSIIGESTVPALAQSGAAFPERRRARAPRRRRRATTGLHDEPRPASGGRPPPLPAGDGQPAPHRRRLPVRRPTGRGRGPRENRRLTPSAG